MNNTDFSRIQRYFNRIGADIVLAKPPFVWNNQPAVPSFDVRTRKDREHFILRCDPKLLQGIQALDVQPKDRHLLIQVVTGEGRNISKLKLLCGHDERRWFVAAVQRTASTVMTAKEALKPSVVVEAQKRVRAKQQDWHKRRQKAYLRQGEWFFLPTPDLQVDRCLILRNEPIQRGRAKPHRCEELYRAGGETVMVSQKRLNGITMQQYEQLVRQQPESQLWRWRRMSRNPTAYARGRVRHPDHSTILLPGWHRIVGNTEVASAQVAFLD